MIMMIMIVIIFISIIIFSNIISIIHFNKYKVNHSPQLPLFNTSHTFWQSNMAHLYQSPQMKFKSFKLRIGWSRIIYTVLNSNKWLKLIGAWHVWVSMGGLTISSNYLLFREVITAIKWCCSWLVLCYKYLWYSINNDKTWHYYF